MSRVGGSDSARIVEFAFPGETVHDVPQLKVTMWPSHVKYCAKNP